MVGIDRMKVRWSDIALVLFAMYTGFAQWRGAFCNIELGPK